MTSRPSVCSAPRLSRWCFPLALFLCLGNAWAWECSPAQVEWIHRLNLDYETPHTKWAKPYARGKIRVLYFVSAPRGRQGMGANAREAVEFMQRFDVDMKVIYWHNFYGEQWLGGNSANFRFNLLMKEHWDVFVFQGVSPSKKPKYGGDDGAKKALAEAVLEGAGVVLLGTDDGGFFKGKKKLDPLPPFLAAIAPNEAFGAGKARLVRFAARPKIPYRLGWREEYDYWQERLGRAVLWAARKEPAVTLEVALPIAESKKPPLPPDDAKSRKKLAATLKDLPPVAAIKQSQLPLDVKFKWRGVKGKDVSWRAVLRRWDGRKKVLGKGSCGAAQGNATLSLPRLGAGGYHIDLHVRGPRGIEGWTTVPFTISSKTQVKIAISSGKTIEFHQISRNKEAQRAADTKVGAYVPYFEIGETLAGTVSVVGPAKGKTVRVQLRDKDERILLREDFKGAAKPSFQFKIESWMPMLLRLEAIVKTGAESITSTYQYVRVVKRRRGRFNFVLWGYPTYETLAPYAAKKLKQMGVTAILDPSAAPLSAAAYGMAWVPWTGGHVNGGHIASWTEEKKKNKGMKHYFTMHTTRSRPHGVLAYSLGDEGATWGYGRGAGSLLLYQKYLKGVYSTIKTLNASWGTKYTDFKEIKFDNPKPDQIAAKYDRWAYGYYNFAHMAKAYRNNIQDVDPKARIGFEGSGGFGGDIDRFCRELDFWVPYAGGSEQIIRSIAPRRFIRGSWMGYHWTAEGLLGSYWRMVTNGCDSVWWWMWSTSWPWNGFQHPDFNGGLPATEEMLRDTRIVREGLGDLLLHYKMMDDGIAILYSMPSNYAVGLTPKKGSPYIRKVEWAHYSWWTIIQDLGLQFRYVTDRMMRLGEFKADQFKVLILPQALAIGPKEATVIKTFAEKGGTVIADFHPGLYDDHSKKTTKGSLDDLFGIQGTGIAKLEELNLEVNGAIGKHKLSFKKAKVAVDTSVNVTNGQPLAKVGKHPAFIVRKIGKGRAILLNIPIWHLAPPRNPPRNMGGVAGEGVTERGVGVLFKEIFASAGIKGRIALVPYKNPGKMPFVANLKVQRWRNGDIEILSLFRNSGRVVRKDMATVMIPEGPQYIYNLKDGITIGKTGYWFTRIRPYRASFFAILPKETPAPKIALPTVIKRGTVIRAMLSVPGAGGLHAIRISARTPKGAAEFWKQIVIVGNKPKEVVLPLALNDPAGTWVLTLSDLFTPKTAHRIRLQIR